jgi:hypothetical protein
MIANWLIANDSSRMVDALPILAAAILLWSYADALQGTWTGRYGASPVSWGLWTALAFIGVFSQLSMGGGPATTLLGLQAAVYTALTTATLIARKTGRAPAQGPEDALSWQRRIDYASGSLALTALVVLVTSGGRNAMILVLAASAIGAVPTATMSWKYPHHIPMRPFAGSSAAALCILAATPGWGFASIGYPTYLFFTGLILATLISLRRVVVLPILPREPVETSAPSPYDETPTISVRCSSEKPLHSDELVNVIPEHVMKLSHVPAHVLVELVEKAYNAGHRTGWKEGWRDREQLVTPDSTSTRRSGGWSPNPAGPKTPPRTPPTNTGVPPAFVPRHL